MKSSLLLVTLALAFGLAVGCSEDGKTGKSGDNGGRDDDGRISCPAGSYPCTYGGGPNGNFGTSTWIYGDLNITSQSRFAAFLESYGYSAFGYAFCVDNRNDVNFSYWGLSVNFGLGTQDCNTYNSARVWIEFSDEKVAKDNTTYGRIYIYPTSSAGGTVEIILPIGYNSSEVRRANANTEFRIQGTLNKMTTPPDLGEWVMRGDTIKIVDDGGANLIFSWDGSTVGTVSAPLYTP